MFPAKRACQSKKRLLLLDSTCPDYFEDVQNSGANMDSDVRYNEGIDSVAVIYLACAVLRHSLPILLKPYRQNFPILIAGRLP
jgi:hypothetical protein